MAGSVPRAADTERAARRGRAPRLRRRAAPMTRQDVPAGWAGAHGLADSRVARRLLDAAHGEPCARLLGCIGNQIFGRADRRARCAARGRHADPGRTRAGRISRRTRAGGDPASGAARADIRFGARTRARALARRGTGAVRRGRNATADAGCCPRAGTIGRAPGGRAPRRASRPRRGRRAVSRRDARDSGTRRGVTRVRASPRTAACGGGAACTAAVSAALVVRRRCGCLACRDASARSRAAGDGAVAADARAIAARPRDSASAGQ